MCDETRRPIQSRAIICFPPSTKPDIDSSFNWISFVSFRAIAFNSHNINRQLKFHPMRFSFVNFSMPLLSLISRKCIRFSQHLSEAGAREQILHWNSLDSDECLMSLEGSPPSTVWSFWGHAICNYRLSKQLASPIYSAAVYLSLDIFHWQGKSYSGKNAARENCDYYFCRSMSVSVHVWWFANSFRPKAYTISVFAYLHSMQTQSYQCIHILIWFFAPSFRTEV